MTAKASRPGSAPLHVHCQNRPADTNIWTITPEAAAGARQRSPELAGQVDISIGWTADDLKRSIATADILIGTAGVVRASFPIDAPCLKWIFSTSAGVDKLLPFDWLPPNVQVVNNSGAHAAKVGEFVQMALLMLQNRMPAFAMQQREERWAKIYSSPIAGRTAVIVGIGGIGGAAAESARKLGMTVIGVSNQGRPHPACARVVDSGQLDAVLPLADFVLICVPLTATTVGLFSRRRLDLLKPGAGLINIARGKVLDNDALADKLDRGELSGAVLDVFDQEPLPAGARLWKTRNLVITPHVSSEDPMAYIPDSLDIFFRNLGCWLDGRPMPNLVDPVRGY